MRSNDFSKTKEQKWQLDFQTSFTRTLNSTQGWQRIWKQLWTLSCPVLPQIRKFYIFSETLWCISESTRCRYSCSKVDWQHYPEISHNLTFTDILPKLRSEFIFRDRIATLASNMIRLKVWVLETYCNQLVLSELFRDGTQNSRKLFSLACMLGEETGSRSGRPGRCSSW